MTHKSSKREDKKESQTETSVYPVTIAVGVFFIAFYVVVASLSDMNWMHSNDAPLFLRVYVAMLFIIGTGIYVCEEFEKDKS